MIRQLHNRLVFGRRIQVLEQHLSDMIPVGSRVLDVGCGDGSIDKLILKRRPDITIDGIDILMRHHAHISVTQCSGKDFPFPDKAFDSVIFVDVLHHIDDPMKLLEEARRVACRSIIIKDHNLNGLAAGIILRLMDWIGNALTASCLLTITGLAAAGSGLSKVSASTSVSIAIAWAYTQRQLAGCLNEVYILLRGST
jgi:SAM-dependent methyltransferase